MTEAEARKLLQPHRLRLTAPRLAVLRALADAPGPLSCSDVVARLGDTLADPATVYRNLVKLHEAGIAPVVSRADGIDRYALAGPSRAPHDHPHFVCERCGHVTCLPGTVAEPVTADGRWTAALEAASVQLTGKCPDCRDQA